MECVKDVALFNDHRVSCREIEETDTGQGPTIYEIFRVVRGVPVFLEDHLERLYHSLELEKLSIEESEAEITRQVRRLIEVNSADDGKIKLVVAFYGEDSGGRYDLMLYFTPFEPPSEADYREGVKTTLCAAMRNDPNAKVMHTEARRLADEKIQQYGVYEALLVDANGYITEGSRSNVFFVEGSRLVTPPDDAVLQGIARRNILRICRRESIPVDVRRVHHNELSAFPAVFLSGTTPKVLPVKAVDDIYYDTNNRFVGLIMEKYDQHLQSYVESRKEHQQ